MTGQEYRSARKRLGITQENPVYWMIEVCIMLANEKESRRSTQRLIDRKAAGVLPTSTYYVQEWVKRTPPDIVVDTRHPEVYAFTVRASSKEEAHSKAVTRILKARQALDEAMKMSASGSDQEHQEEEAA